MNTCNRNRRLSIPEPAGRVEMPDPILAHGFCSQGPEMRSQLSEKRERDSELFCCLLMIMKLERIAFFKGKQI